VSYCETYSYEAYHRNAGEYSFFHCLTFRMKQ
jgi:hypothetical protein